MDTKEQMLANTRIGWDKAKADRVEAQKLLDMLIEQEEMFEKAWNAIKMLPDQYFSTNPNLVTIPQEIGATNASDKKEDTKKREYGYNKKVVVNILNEAQVVMLKEQIVKKYEEISGDKDATNAVTNALAALTTDGLVAGHKIGSVKVRGLFWGLKQWEDMVVEGWDIDYQPKQFQNTIERYLN